MVTSMKTAISLHEPSVTGAMHILSSRGTCCTERAQWKRMSRSSSVLLLGKLMVIISIFFANRQRSFYLGANWSSIMTPSITNDPLSLNFFRVEAFSSSSTITVREMNTLLRQRVKPRLDNDGMNSCHHLKSTKVSDMRIRKRDCIFGMILSNSKLVSSTLFNSLMESSSTSSSVEAKEKIKFTTLNITWKQLNKMTVKELKSYIQDNSIDIPQKNKNPSITSVSRSLKLKKDIVNFIWDHLMKRIECDQEVALHDNTDNHNLEKDQVLQQVSLQSSHNDNMGNLVIKTTHDYDNNNDSGYSQLIERSKASSNDDLRRPKLPKQSTRTKKFIGAGMPPLPLSKTGEKSIAQLRLPSPSFFLTPKDRIVMDVLQRYPPLYDAVLAVCSPNSGSGTNTTFQLPMNEDSYDDSNSIKKNSVKQAMINSIIDHCNLSSLSYPIPSGLGENDMRQRHHPMLANITQSDLDIVFIGTASCTPGITRGVSCTAVRLNWRNQRVLAEQQRNRGGIGDDEDHLEGRGSKGGTWLFDCGEATQLNIQRTTSVKPGKISKIFITHCHGDHSFGLPGLLCLMGTDRDRDAPPIEVYGPEGLRMWLRVAIRYSVSRIVPFYRVHELMDVPMAPEWVEGHRKNGRFYFQQEGGGGSRWGTKGLSGEDPISWISRAPMISLEPSKDFGEIDGGRDIYPLYNHPQCADGAPIWEVENDGDVSVYAAPMSHGVPCVGYIIQEHDRPGRLRPEIIQPIIERNFNDLINSGFRNPLKVMAMVKNLPIGGNYTFPDGTILKQEDVVEPPQRGRKLVLCGDTADCRALEGLAQDADVLIHEATNTFLPGIDKDGNVKLVTRDAKIHGHSTPFMAGEFASRIRAKKLILNHFSARYKGDQSIESVTIMTRIERQAIKASGLSENSVACAWDFMILPVPRK